MGEILEIVIFMWIIAVIAFAPLGYFIYLFTIGNGESFGKSNPEDHSVEHTSYYKHIDFVLSTLLGGTSGSKPTAPAASSTSASISDAPKPRPRPKSSTVESSKKAKDKKKKSKSKT